MIENLETGMGGTRDNNMDTLNQSRYQTQAENHHSNHHSSASMSQQQNLTFTQQQNREHEQVKSSPIRPLY